MLVETTLFEKVDKVEIAIERLKIFEPPEGYYLAFSGGKDSVVIKELADRAGVKYDAHYNATTIDPPELIYFIREHHHEVVVERPEMPFLVWLARYGFPIRQNRSCCRKYKERGGSGRYVVTGVRSAESVFRRRRRMIEHCYRDTTKHYVNPIIDWTDEDVWQFIKENDVPYCSLYDEGWKRIGCLLCPCAGGSTRRMEAQRYPKMTRLFIKAFEKLWGRKKSEGRTSVDRWADGEEMFWWWLNDDRKPEEKGQLTMFE